MKPLISLSFVHLLMHYFWFWIGFIDYCGDKFLFNDRLEIYSFLWLLISIVDLFLSGKGRTHTALPPIFPLYIVICKIFINWYYCIFFFCFLSLDNFWIGFCSFFLFYNIVVNITVVFVSYLFIFYFFF